MSSATGQKCWDSATNQVRNETMQTGNSNTGSTTNPSTSSSSSGMGSGSSSATSTTTAQTRPPEAVGLPDCK